MDQKMNNRGQVAIFVVVAIILVAGILLLVFLRSGRISPAGTDASNVEQYIGRCVRESTQRALETMIPQGGFIAPQDYKLYQDVKATYICKNVNYYQPCVNQYPQYMQSLQNEISTQVGEDLSSCLIALSDELERKNYDVTYTTPAIEISIVPNFVNAKVLTKMALVKNDQRSNYEEFNIEIRTPLYNLASTAQVIASQEAQYCYFEYLGYSLLHPEVSVKKFTMSDATRIYTIADTKTGSKMNIAIRGCAIPAGF